MGIMFIVAYPLMLFIAIPERIYLELNLNPEDMNILPFLLVWILIFATIYLSIKILTKIVKYLIKYFKN